ncbi:hypothetical protein E3U43_003959 [Xyrichtys novacula]|uniref:Uncharacterized protein n=1 Tax=Xyrichtys novacula TaxID=13765 RepID=A0AAV1EQG4_XYRNO|nr:hypothetical protein E3U43_003959 [Xyrichtys novacula]
MRLRPSSAWSLTEWQSEGTAPRLTWQQCGAKGWHEERSDICCCPALRSSPAQPCRRQISTCPHTSKIMLCPYCLVAGWRSASLQYLNGDIFACQDVLEGYRVPR